jgi:hypothetical protein
MKYRFSFKDPDEVYDEIDRAVKASLAALDLSDKEKEILFETRREAEVEKLSKWIRYGEYVSVEIDTDTGIARVRQTSESE